MIDAAVGYTVGFFDQFKTTAVYFVDARNGEDEMSSVKIASGKAGVVTT